MKKSNLTIHAPLARKILTGFIHSEITRTGFKKAVLGLSGGIDSALSCFLAAEALGPDNVLAIRMPYRTSSQDSLDDAQRVIDATSVRSMTVEITDMVDPLIAKFPEMDAIRKGNIMARMRMIVLYDQSAAEHSLVVGTSNKTEMLLGYSTVFGDAACAINPLGDLYKTQVRQLSADIGVPQEIIGKPPSADLWMGQTDEADLGFTYEDADQLLYLMVDKRYSRDECVAEGFDAAFTDAVVSRIQRYHFKRVMPPIAKLSNRTIGYDFLYLRDMGT
ncbi:MAG: NAD+ synthase [Anaerolineaceae bacterium]|nr:NAD+ synthase [Anaerolineaceae bacterium]